MHADDVRASADESRAALVALLRHIGLDVPGIVERVEDDGPLAVLIDVLSGAVPAPGQRQTSLFADDEVAPRRQDPDPLLAAAAAELETWARAGIRPLTVLDDAYPVNLRGVHDRPALLFAAGHPAVAGEKTLAVVGARHPSADGRTAAAAITGDLVAAGYTVASGLASGIDTAAHQAALDAGGRTAAVIGTGLGRAFPPENAALQARLASEHLVLSPFWPGAPPSAETFRRRNGVTSGVSQGTVIVEASPRSGTRVLARLALAHGRPVFLLQALLAQQWAIDLARRDGVHVIDGAGDMLAILERLHAPGLHGPS